LRLLGRIPPQNQKAAAIGALAPFRPIREFRRKIKQPRQSALSRRSVQFENFAAKSKKPRHSPRPFVFLFPNPCSLFF
jgi:hypothetical protein